MNTPDFWLFLKDWTIWQFSAMLPHGNNWLEQNRLHFKFFFSISLSRLDFFLIIHVICLGMSIPKEINPEYSLEWLLLKLQYFGHLIQRADSLEKTLMLGKIEGRRRREVAEDEMVRWYHWLNGHEFEQAPGDGETVCCSPWGHKQSNMMNWTTTINRKIYKITQIFQN